LTDIFSEGQDPHTHTHTHENIGNPILETAPGIPKTKRREFYTIDHNEMTKTKRKIRSNCENMEQNLGDCVFDGEKKRSVRPANNIHIPSHRKRRKEIGFMFSFSRVCHGISSDSSDSKVDNSLPAALASICLSFFCILWFRFG
jgi:hypothetical protein